MDSPLMHKTRIFSTVSPSTVSITTREVSDAVWRCIRVDMLHVPHEISMSPDSSVPIGTKRTWQRVDSVTVSRSVDVDQSDFRVSCGEMRTLVATTGVRAV